MTKYAGSFWDFSGWPCSAQSLTPRNRSTEDLSRSPRASNPRADSYTATSAVIPRVVYSNVLEGLVKIDRTGKIVPKRWPVIIRFRRMGKNTSLI